MKKLILVLTVFLFASCSNQNKSPSIFADSSCELPCWKDIRIGETSREELISIISEEESIDQETVATAELSQKIWDETFMFSFSQPNNKTNSVRVVINLKNGVVVNLIFYGNVGLELSQIFGILGTPDLVNADWNDRGTIDLLLFSSNGFSYGVEIDDESNNLSPNTQIIFLELFLEEMYQELLESGYLTLAPYNPQDFNYYSWSGYGIVEEKYWPPRK